jgi:PPP family 3-phenylpropionic acid transporter
MSSARQPLLPFAALSATYFAYIGFFNPYLTLWLKAQGYSLLAIGMLAAVPSITRLFGPYAWGWLSDHTGHRVQLMRYAGTMALLLSLGLWLQSGPLTLGAVLFLIFCHTSALMPMSEATLAHIVSHGGQFDPARYGRVRLWGSLGFLITVFVAGAWFEWRSIQDFPGWTTFSLLLVVACVWMLPDQREAQSANRPAPAVGPILRQPVVAWFFASIFFHILAHMGLYIYFSLHLDVLGYSKTAIGLMWAASVLVEIVWFYTQGRWMARWSHATWLIVCAALVVLRMAVTASMAAWWPVLLLVQALHAWTFATHHTVCVAFLSQHFPGKLRGRGQGLYSALGYGVSGVIGGYAGGLISSRWGLPAVFWACSVCGLFALACAWRVRTWMAHADRATG